MPKLFPALDCLGSRELPPRAVISVVVEVAMTSLCVERLIHRNRTGCIIMGATCEAISFFLSGRKSRCLLREVPTTF